MDADEFIGVKSHRAKGKRLSNLTLDEVIWLEPLRKDAEVAESGAAPAAVGEVENEEGEESVPVGTENQLELF